ncbi:hypothetical protein PQI51_10150 [Microbacterium esteraromaticum]|uniref:hypothetical protein n=1 Tax=Microbacterium esteraromaticum TaxID=57043 RepID=UPI0030A2DFB5
MALIAGSIFTFSGCSTPAGQFSDLQADRTPKDELPVLAEEYAYEGVDPSTSRYVGDHDGTSLWIVEGLAESPICLVAVAGESEWFVSCGGATGVGLKGIAGDFLALPDGALPPEKATKVSENVYATMP